MIECTNVKLAKYAATLKREQKSLFSHLRQFIICGCRCGLVLRVLRRPLE